MKLTPPKGKINVKVGIGEKNRTGDLNGLERVPRPGLPMPVSSLIPREFREPTARATTGGTASSEPWAEPSPCRSGVEVTGCSGRSLEEAGVS